MKKFTARDQLEFVKTKSQKRTKNLGIIILIFLVIIIVVSLISCASNETKPVAKVFIQKEECTMMIYGEFPKGLTVGEKIVISKVADARWTYCEPSVEFMRDTVIPSSFNTNYQSYRWATILEIYSASETKNEAIDVEK